ncbi:MAG TPA: TldD/PmbA family protein [Methanocorpusculum sp.]|nr:TldD/PmbA family protein [Methanocorpusculum sp.]
MDTIRYYDIRCVNGNSSTIQIENGSIENAVSSSYGKALIRVLGKHGWGYCCVSPFDIDNGRHKKQAIEKAAHSARLATVHADIADVSMGVPRSWNAVSKEQEERSLEEKTADLLLLENHAKKAEITATSARYAEQYQDVLFENCNGCEASSSVCRTLFTVTAVAERNADMQMNYEQEAVIGPLKITDYLHRADKCAETAVNLLDASTVPGGTLPVVLDPAIAGVFAHEAVGHASEGDQVRDGISVLGDKLGQVVGSQLVTIIDDPSMHNYGYEPFDAEGVANGPCELIKNGVMNKFMHSRETLAAVGLDSGDAGHARAEPGMQPLVRMSNTYIKEGDASYEEILETCKNGILLIGSRGGQVDPGRGVFQFNAKYGYQIVNGESSGMLRDVSLSGDILSALHNIALCGKERKMSSGMCGKGQNVPVSDGAPHVYLTKAVVGGTGQ